MDNAKYNEVVELFVDEQPEEFRNKVFSVGLFNPLPVAQTFLIANRGCGKSTLLREMHERLMRDGQVCVRIVGEDKLTIPAFTVLASDDVYDVWRYANKPCFDAEEIKVTMNRFSRLVVEGSWRMPPPSGKKAWEPAKWQGGTDHEAPLKHGKDPKAVAKRRKKKKLATRR